MATMEQKTPLPIYIAIVITMVGVFISDLYTPQGVTVWVIYLAPVVLSLFTWRPLIPLALAVTTSALIVIGFLLRPRSVAPGIAEINRCFGALTVWIMAVASYLFIRGKLAVNRQEWLQAGQVRLKEKMSGELSLEQLGENILRFLAEYLGAQVGAIFVEDGGVFRRRAAYAVPADARVPEQITPEDGLLGQAVKDGRSFILSDVPKDYLYVGSGLGRSRPRHLLIAPVRADSGVNAVLEFGFLGRKNESFSAGTELLERVSPSVGIAVRSANYRVQLHELLKETQRQAEGLQAQSEELRVNNEELEEQRRALQESQARLEIQQTELEQTNAQLEEQTQTLEEQTRELEQASRYKSEFLANMSHELRTPLNSSLILASLLAENREGNLTPEQVEHARMIEVSGNDLLALINDILDLSKIEAGRTDVRPERTPVSRLVENLSRTFQPVAAQKGLEFRTRIATDAPEEVETDPQRLEQILKNLLSNALKFTERGEVTLEVKRPGAGHVAFAVRDTGIGISADQQQVIFEAFRQADGTTIRKYGGTGLGLSISRELARLLGGDIRVASEKGRGSVFTLTIPEFYGVARVKPRVSDVAPDMALDVVIDESLIATEPVAPLARVSQIEDDRERLTGGSRVILIVEDDEKFARVLRDLAHELDFQCLVAVTADEGAMIARQYLPHAVILDIGLPDHTGLTVLDRLKHDRRTRHIPVHIVSIHDYTQTALEYGAVGYILKPVKRDQLVQTLEGLERRLTRRVRRVLVVEDDAVQLESIRRLLALREVETVGAQTAAECLEQLKATTFDCMVLDLSLPDVSGFDLLEQLSRDESYAFPPVIIYTGRDLTSDEELLLRRYSKSIIIKGAKSPERLLSEVTLFLHQVVAELPIEQRKMIEKAMSRDAILEGRRILVVEDDVRNVFALTSVLEQRGAIVQIARNGREALEALERSSQSGAPPIDLALMDVMMPEMDGLQATREIRKRSEWKNFPIITLTAKAMPHDQEQCLAAGASDYLAKPLDVEKLLSLIRVWMPR